QEPLVDEAEDELLAAPPACRIPMAVRRFVHEGACRSQSRDDGRGRLEHTTTGERTEPRSVAAILPRRRHRRQAVTKAELEVFLTAAGRDVDHAGSLVGSDIVPRDDAVLDAALGGELVKRPDIAEADELRASDALAHVAETGESRSRRGRDVIEA